MLLARLQREHETASAVHVGGLSRDTAGHAAQIVLARGEEAKRRAAEVQAIAERLALPHRHVHAALSRRCEDAERDRVDLGDRDELLAARGLGGGG